MRSVRLLTMILASSSLAACGARASLSLIEASAGGSGGGGGTGGSIVADAGPDVIVADAGCHTPAQCDDGVACTLDECTNGVCTNTPLDSVCDDGLFCNGVERCDPILDCVSAPPPACDDGIACTHDDCDGSTQACIHTPDDSFCPLSHKCGATEGCYALAYAHSDTTLYEVRLPSGAVTKIGPTLVQLTDIALASNNQLLGLDFASLYLVDTTTGAAKPTQPAHAQGMVAFDLAPDGQLYGAGTTGFYRLGLNPPTADWVASFPAGWEASGDLAFLQGRFLATARQGFSGIDALVEVDLASGTSKVVGSTGFACVWGLAAFGATLYGLTCNGAVLSINPQSGAGTQIAASNVAFWGAAAR